jgi:type II secretory pathway component GspD/PulD (secretin)
VKKAEAGHGHFLTALSDREVYLLLETIQADRTTRVMQTPKLTIPDGKTASLRLDREPLSVKAPVPTVSGEPVKVELKGDGPCSMPLAESFAVESGKTALLGGWCTGRTPAGGVPVLSDVPFLSQMFGLPPARDPECILILVTPTAVPKVRGTEGLDLSNIYWE